MTWQNILKVSDDEEKIVDGIESEKVLVMKKTKILPIHEKENQSFQP